MSETITGLLPQQRMFINRRVLKRQPTPTPRLPDTPKPPQRRDGAEDTRRYNAAAAKLQRLFDSAEAVLAARPPLPGVAQVEGAYGAAANRLAADLRIPDYVQALATLQAKQAAAEAVLAAKAADEAERLRQKQFDDQLAIHQEMAPVLTDVKKGYLPDGASKRIGKEKLSPEPEFKAYLTALQTLETAKKGVDPSRPFPANLAQDLKAKCDTLIATAQAYLDHYERDLTDLQKNAKVSLTKKRYCEESLIAARHYGMAMELDTLGAPQPDQPWDRETEIRVAGLRAQVNFETGYFKAKGLKDDGTGGASDSYWIRSGSPQDTQDESGRPRVTMVANKRGEAIFKPIDGEEAPDGSTDRKGAGAAKESLARANAKLFGAMTGIDLGVPETSVVSISGNAVEGADPNGPPLLGSAQQHAGVKDQIKDLPRGTLKKIKPDQAHKIALMDIMSLSIDRHSGNIMVDNADPENPQLIPIDHGGTLPSRSDFAGTKNRMGGINRSTSSGAVTIVNTLLTIPSSYENFDPEMVAKIDRLDPEAIEQGMKAQRTALDKVHPDLGATSKVGDDSLQMSKRSMMFLKRAARTLSPAEIQITLTARGEELFDVDDHGFAALADQIIAEAAAMKPAYQEFMTSPTDEQVKILTWLNDNGWTLADENGSNTPEAFLLRDPVTALKLYKSQKANDAVLPTPPAPLPKWTTPTGDDLPDDGTKQDMLAAFPKMQMPGTDAQWKTRLACWRVIQAKGGMAAYRAALQATGAQDEQAIGSAAETVTVWEEINKPQYQAALAQLKPESGTRKAASILRKAMSVEANRQLAGQQLNQARTAGNGVDERAALIASAKRLLAEADQLIANLLDKDHAAAFQIEANFAAGQLDKGEVKEAETEAQKLIAEITEFGLQEATAEGLQISARLDGLQLSDAQAKRAAGLTSGLKAISSLSTVRDSLQMLRDLEQEARTGGAPPKPIVPPQQNAPQGAPQRQVPDQGVVLPDFTWSQSGAAAAKKQAVKAKLIKDQETGMTKALAAVIKARTAVEEMKDTASAATKRKLLTKALDAHLAFSRFIASKLIGLSQDAGWRRYCDSASNLAEQGVVDMRTRLGELPEGPG